MADKPNWRIQIEAAPEPGQVKMLVRLDPELRRELRIAAARAGVSMNEVIRTALRHWLKLEEARRESPCILEPACEPGCCREPDACRPWEARRDG